jgi:DNA-binding response OmpR family regulator
MKVLIAEDDPVSRRLLEAALKEWGFAVISACNGEEALRLLQDDTPPRLAVLDWVMPGLTGPEVCQAVRSTGSSDPPYLILLTSRESSEDVVRGLEAGANDYITKPFEFQELRARVRVGQRVISLQSELADRVRELQAALSNVKQLQGLLPMCSYCKRVRDDQNYWQQVEVYLARHSDAQLSHGLCPECYETVVKPQLKQFLGENSGS